MPKNSATLILKRWRAMDWALAREGLHVPSFARRWKVSTKTVTRDLGAFRELGQKMDPLRDEDGRTYWRYYADVKPIFRH